MDCPKTTAALTLRSRRFVLAATVLCTVILLCYKHILMEPERIWERSPKNKEGQQVLSDDVTLVTSYLNLGSFQKGEGNLISRPETYRQWMTVFRLIRNPVIAYFDNDDDLQLFKTIRKTMPMNMTKVVKMSKGTTWAFSLRSSIGEIFSQTSYPKHHPNTVIPGYSSAMHAKYEFIEMALKENPFTTKYFAWLDMGYFRDLVNKSKEPFVINLPPKFDDKKIAYGELQPLSKHPMSAKQIVEANIVWVCGGFFVGKYDVMQRWTKQYRGFTERMIKLKWISTDQQVLYYMFQPQQNQSGLVNVQIQAFKSDGHSNPWFYLAYASSKPWNKKT